MQDLTLEEIVTKYAIRKQLKSDTIALYRYASRAFERFLTRTATLADFTDDTLAAFIAWRRLQVSQETLRGESSKLLALWRWASSGKQRWIEPPEIDAPQASHRIAKALDRDQLAKLFQAAKDYPGRVGTLPGNVVLLALLYTLWDSSERIGAIYDLERSNVFLRELLIVIEAESRKGGKVPRWYRVRPETGRAVGELMRVYAGEKPFAECSLSNYYQHLRKLRERAGLPPWFTYHTLRRSHASHLTALGGDARRSLGHSSESMTDRYRDPRIVATGQQPCDLLFDPLAKKGWLRRILG